jgi:hypothetical protein
VRNQASFCQFVSIEVVNPQLSQRVSYNEEVVLTDSDSSRVYFLSAASVIVYQNLLGDSTSFIEDSALPKSQVAIVAAGDDADGILKRLMDKSTRVDCG